MDIDYIIKLIKIGEGISTEFKEFKNKLPSNLFETICAFLNRYGGNVFLGVDDDGNIVGVDEQSIKQIKKDFATMCNNPQIIDPIVTLTIKEYMIEMKMEILMYLIILLLYLICI